MSEMKYPNLRLYKNPFEVSVERDVQSIQEIIEDVNRFCLDIRAKEYERIKKVFLLPLLNPSEGKAENLWVRGTKGVGKSILLKKLAYDLYGKPDIVVLYVKVPEEGLDIQGIYKRSIQWLGQSTFEKLALKIYEDFIKNMSLNVAARIFKVPPDQLEQFTANLKELVTKQPEIIFKIFSKDPSAIKEMEDLGINPGMIKLNALTYQVSVNCVANHNLYKKFADLISTLPENPAEGYVRIREISAKEVVPVFIAIEKAFSKFFGTRAVVIILDEFEIAWLKMSEKQRITMVVAVRALHDASQGNIKFISTMTEEVFELLKEGKYKHILDVIPRTTIGRNIIDVSSLDTSQAIRLAEFLLSQEGVRPPDAKFVHPFEPEVIEVINRKVQGITRELINDLKQIVDEAEERGMKIINIENLLKISDVYEPYVHVPHS
jgi:GTPase SAR1 family protein